MRYSASDKTEIIRLVEQSPWPARRTLEKLGIPRSSFYRWYDRYQRGGPEALADRPSGSPLRIAPHGQIGFGTGSRRLSAVRLSTWRCQIVDLALDQPELSPRELAVRFTDEEKYFVSEASVYRLLKAHDLITSPAYIVIKAAEEFTFEKINPSDLTWLCFAKILASVAYAPCGSLAEPTRAAFTELCLGAGMACWALAFRGLGEDLCAKMQVSRLLIQISTSAASTRVPSFSESCRLRHFGQIELVVAQ
jgi:hypothetical protein